MVETVAQNFGPTGLNGDLPLAVKALATFALGSDEAGLKSLSDACGMEEKDLRLFMRLNASEDTLRAHGERVRAGLFRWMDQHGIVLPASLRPLATALRGEDTEDPTTPFFLDAERIGHALPTLPGGRTFLSTYAGLWRVFRYSTQDEVGDKGKAFNRSYLNIKPTEVLTETGRSAPHFSMMFREGRNRPGFGERAVAPFGKATGLVFPLGERITFIGTRRSGVNPHPLIMVWVADERELGRRGGRVDIALGLALMPNASGDHVASYALAQRIDVSSKGDVKQNYRDARDAELAKVGRYFLDNEEHLTELTTTLGESDFNKFMHLNEHAAATLTVG